jgi:hypothetical protein
MQESFRQHGAFSWCELMTNDVHAAKKFYTDLFGWSTEDISIGGMTYTVIKAQDREIGGMMAFPPQACMRAPYWGTYVTVDDVDTTAAKAQKLGAKSIVPPTDIPNVGRFCMFQDPQGAVISAITYSMTM